MTIPDHIKRDAETAAEATARGDWSLATHIRNRYRPGSPDRIQFDWISKELATLQNKSSPVGPDKH